MRDIKVLKSVFRLLIVTISWLLLPACTSQVLPPSPDIQPEIIASPTIFHAPVLVNSPVSTITSLPVPTGITPPAPSPVPPTFIPTTFPTPVETELPVGSTRISDADQMVQVYVPSGEFIMGSDAIEAKITLEGGRAYPEIPVNTVYLDGYWIDKYEVTNGQYALCVEAGSCQAPYSPSSETHYYYYGYPEFSNYPVLWVNWYMARNYCEWAGRRLPTEAEWEKAARGTDGQEYPWGNEPLTGERANFCDINCERTIANPVYNDGYADVAPVGSYPMGASPYGALDMSGNVWEWTGSLIMPYPYDPTDGRENLDANGERVWRGGPWSNGTWWMRSSVRYRSIPTYWWVNLGFRCASSR
jgi:formylglycine-generating enzyme required for sulfatase activity